MKKFLTLTLCFLLLASLLTGCSKEVTVDFDLENISVEAEDTAFTKKEYTATLEAEEYYVLPDEITVTMDGEVIEEGYTYDAGTGEIVIDAKAVTGEVGIEAEAEKMVFMISDKDLTNLTLDAEKAVALEDISITLSAPGGYILPEAVTVKVDGKELTEGFAYDAATGKLTIEGAAVTGDIAIEAVATESLVGLWNGKVEMTSLINEFIATDPSMANYFSFSELYFTLTLEFTEDGGSIITFSQDSIDKLADLIIEQMKPGVKAMIEAAMQAEGLNISYETFLALTGMSEDDLLADLRDSLMAELDGIAGQSMTSTYEVKDGKLYLGEGGGSEYTLENGVLTIQAPEGESIEGAEFLFPMTLTRAE